MMRIKKIAPVILLLVILMSPLVFARVGGQEAGLFQLVRHGNPPPAIRHENIGGSGQETDQEFVIRDGSRLVLKDKTFYFSGANAYYLFFQDNGVIDQVFETANSLGIKVIRTWGFCDGVANAPKNSNGDSLPYVFQPSRGNWSDQSSVNAFNKMDYIINSAAAHGIKLIIALVNYWEDFGGMDQYVSWAGGTDRDSFYSDPICKVDYKNYVAHFLNKDNALRGMKYKDDPTILAWELANEPRVNYNGQDDSEYNRRYGEMKKWVNEMAQYVKSIDNKHLVSAGTEGFDLKRSIRVEGEYDSSAIDFAGSTYIDLVSVHFWPDHADPFTYPTEFKTIEYIYRSIDSAIKQLNKPVYLGEFGILTRRESDTDKEVLYGFNSSGDAEGWVNVDISGGSYSFSTPQIASSENDPKYEGIGSIKLTTATDVPVSDPLNSIWGKVAAGVERNAGNDVQFIKLNGKKYITAYVYIPKEEGIPDSLKASIFVKYRMMHAWASSQEFLLTPTPDGKSFWTRIYLDFNEVYNADGNLIIMSEDDISKIKTIGIQIRTAGKSSDESDILRANKSIYVDLIEAMKGDTEQEIIRRNSNFEKICNEVYSAGGAGAIVWQLFTGSSKSYLDDNFGFYPAIDTTTSDIIGHFSSSMKAKSDLPAFSWNGCEETDKAYWDFDAQNSAARSLDYSSAYILQGFNALQSVCGLSNSSSIFFNAGPKDAEENHVGLRENWMGKNRLIGFAYVPQDSTAGKISVGVSTMQPLSIEEGDEDGDRIPYEWKYPKENPADPQSLIKWEWYESKPRILVPGAWNLVIDDLQGTGWKYDSGDDYNLQLQYLNQIEQFSLKVFHSKTGNVFEDFEAEDSANRWHADDVNSTARFASRMNKSGANVLKCDYNGTQAGHAFFITPKPLDGEPPPDYMGMNDWSKRNTVSFQLVDNNSNINGARQLKVAISAARIIHDDVYGDAVDPDNSDWYESEYIPILSGTNTYTLNLKASNWKKNSETTYNSSIDSLSAIRLFGIDIKHDRLGSEIWDECSSLTYPDWNLVPSTPEGPNIATGISLIGSAPNEVFKLDYSADPGSAKCIKTGPNYQGLDQDWTAKTTVRFDLAVPQDSDIDKATIAVQTGSGGNWAWNQLAWQDVSAGQNYIGDSALTFDITGVPDRGRVQALALVFKHGSDGGQTNNEWYDDCDQSSGDWDIDSYTDAARIDVSSGFYLLAYNHRPGIAGFKRNFTDGSSDGSKDWTNKNEVVANIYNGNDSGATEVQLALYTGVEGARNWFYSLPQELNAGSNNELHFVINNSNWSMNDMDGDNNQVVSNLNRVKIVELIVRHRIPLGNPWDDCGNIADYSGHRSWGADIQNDKTKSDAQSLNATSFAGQNVLQLNYYGAESGASGHSKAYYYIPIGVGEWSLDNNWGGFSSVTIKTYVPDGVPGGMLAVAPVVVDGNGDWYYHEPQLANNRGINVNVNTFSFDSSWRKNSGEEFRYSIGNLDKILKFGIMVMHPYSGGVNTVYLDNIDLNSAIGGPATAKVYLDNIGIFPQGQYMASRPGNSGLRATANNKTVNSMNKREILRNINNVNKTNKSLGDPIVNKDGIGGSRVGGEQTVAGSLYIDNIKLLPPTGSSEFGTVYIDNVLTDPALNNADVYFDDFRLYTGDIFDLEGYYYPMHMPVIDVSLDKVFYYIGETASLNLFADNLSRMSLPLDIYIVKEQPEGTYRYLDLNGVFQSDPAAFFSYEANGVFPGNLTISVPNFVTFSNAASTIEKGALYVAILEHNTQTELFSNFNRPFKYVLSNNSAPQDEGRDSLGSSSPMGGPIRHTIQDALGQQAQTTPLPQASIWLNKGPGEFYFQGDTMYLNASVEYNGAEDLPVDFYLAFTSGDVIKYVSDDPVFPTYVDGVHCFPAVLHQGTNSMANLLSVVFNDPIPNTIQGSWYLVITPRGSWDHLAEAGASFTLKPGGIGGQTGLQTDIWLNKSVFRQGDTMYLSANVEYTGQQNLDVDFYLAFTTGSVTKYVTDQPVFPTYVDEVYCFPATLAPGTNSMANLLSVPFPNPIPETIQGSWYLVITPRGSWDHLAEDGASFTLEP